MSTSAPTVLLVGPAAGPSMLSSYGRALTRMGCRVVAHDIAESVRKRTRLGVAGRRLNDFIPVEPWIAKANRDMVIAALDERADVVLVPGAAPVRAGALAQIRASRPSAQIVLLWPDPLVNLGGHVISALPTYDLVATYSQATLREFEYLGARRTVWIPFGVDDIYFSTSGEARPQFACDVGFVGNYRPEREEAILALLRAGFHIRVWGEADWKKNARFPDLVSRYWEGHPIYGDDLGQAFRSFKINLNVIDRTNFPSANMRFFESAGLGGVTLNSSCPEMASTFVDGEHAAYFDTLESAVDVCRELLQNPSKRHFLAERGRALALASHTYTRRAEALLDLLGALTSARQALR